MPAGIDLRIRSRSPLAPVRRGASAHEVPLALPAPLGRALMLPIAVLPIAGLLLRFRLQAADLLDLPS